MPSWSPCSICCNSRPAVSNAWPQQEISLLRLRGHLWVLCHDMWLKYKIIWTKVLHAHRRKKYYKDATDWYYYFCVVLSRVQLFVTPQTAAHQAPLSTEFSRQEYWRGLPLPTPGIFLTQGPNSHFLHWQTDSLPLCQLGNSNYCINLSVTEYSSTSQASYLHFIIVSIDTLHFILCNICKPRMTECGGHLLRSK